VIRRLVGRVAAGLVLAVSVRLFDAVARRMFEQDCCDHYGR
jgi:hypothetical protein